MKDIINNIVNAIKNKKVLFGIIAGLSATIILTIAIVLGVVISSKITCKHDNPYEIEILPYKEATCIEEGLSSGKKCNYCGKTFVEQKVIPKTDCIKTESLPYKEPTCIQNGLTEGKKCTVCGKIVAAQEIINKKTCQEEWFVDIEPSNTEDGKWHAECMVCGKFMYEKVILAGNKKLEYSLLDNNTYSVLGNGDCIDANIVIPSVYNGLPVTSIGEYAFIICVFFESITIPSSVESIGEYAFYGCTCTSIYYEGTMEQWNAIEFGRSWNDDCHATEVICLDGMVPLN